MVQKLVQKIVQKLVQWSNGPIVQWSSPYFTLCREGRTLPFMTPASFLKMTHENIG